MTSDVPSTVAEWNVGAVVSRLHLRPVDPDLRIDRPLVRSEKAPVLSWALVWPASAMLQFEALPESCFIGLRCSPSVTSSLVSATTQYLVEALSVTPEAVNV